MDSRRSFIIGVSIGLLCSYFYYLLISFSVCTFDKKIRNYQFFRRELSGYEFQPFEKATHDVVKLISENTSCQQVSKSNSDLQCDLVDMMKLIQAERQYILRKTCQQSLQEPPRKDNPFYVQKNALHSKNYKISVCQIQKCGSSSWLRAILVMDNFFTVESHLKGEIIGETAMGIAKKFASIGSIKDKYLARKTWMKSLKIILVRNPFSRLVSAYHDKMVLDGDGFSSYYGPISKTINKMYRNIRHNITERTIKDDGGATFEDFINFLCFQKDNDEHWKSYDLICNPCLANYDYIAKFETITEDMNNLKIMLNISDYHKRAFFESNYLRTDDKKTAKAFEKIPKQLANKLYEVYKKDFELFGYEKPSWL